MNLTESIEINYPGALAWSFGDSAEMADELANLVVRELKTASCGSYFAFKNDDTAPAPGDYSIILNGKGMPVCVIRTVALRLIRFDDVTEDHARKEGEGDLSLRYWRQAHKAFFQREGCWSANMEVVTEEFEVVEIV